jgi:GNAT superfamily N-acetyltransferase
MTIERIDPLELDDATADRCAEISNVSARAIGLDLGAPVTGASFAGQVRYTHDDRPVDALWLARDDGVIVGHASMDLPTWDNQHMGLVFCSVHPDHLGRGIGTQLLEAQVAAVEAAGRSMLLTFAFRDGPTARLLPEHGFEAAQGTAQRRLRPQEFDYDAIQAYADEASTHAEDYELVRLDGPAPEEWLPHLVEVFESISDAPLDDIDLTPDSYPVERVRNYERAMAARGQHLYRLMARHRGTDAWAGHTILCVDEQRPGVAMQEDTTVVGAHRGHRLGMWLKATMLLWMRDAEPGLETIDTWNAETNAHMIAVNDKLGCFVNARGVVLQRHLDGVDR